MTPNGLSKPGSPTTLEHVFAPLYYDSGETQPVLVDLNGGSEPEILVITTRGVVYGFRANGTPLPEFPVELTTSYITGSPLVVEDIDSDGRCEILINTAAEKKVRVWELPWTYANSPSEVANKRKNDWATVGGNPQRRNAAIVTGTLLEPTPTATVALTATATSSPTPKARPLRPSLQP